MTRRRILLLTALLAPAAASAGTLTSILQIPAPQDVYAPATTLVKSGTRLYGTSAQGGAANAGTVFSVLPRTGAVTILHSFTAGPDGSTPVSALTPLNGLLYGATFNGGANGGGTIFSIDPATGAYAVIAGLPDNTKPNGPMVAEGGLLYGSAPNCGNNAGCLFSFDPATSTTTILYHFGLYREGQYPNAIVAHDGALFGTTIYGGTIGHGVVFRFDLESGNFKILHDFGTSNDDGNTSEAPLTFLDGLFYGTTNNGGATGFGTIFSIDPRTKTETVLHSFAAGTGGSFLSAGLATDGTLLYGVTTAGGTEDLGVLFSMDPASGAVTPLHSFSGAFGGFPDAALSVDGGVLYGFVERAGIGNAGALFAFDPAQGAFTTLHSFAGTARPNPSSLVLSGGALYGVVSTGGAYGFGGIVKLLPGAQTGSIVHSFSGLDGADPIGKLTDIGGTLYGSTSTGGTFGLGTIFSFAPKTHSLATLYSFPGGDGGANPRSALSPLGGTLYGTTAGGGTGARGTVFGFTIATAQASVLHSFANGEQGQQSNGVTVVGGVLYGTTLGGTHDDGEIFRIDPASSTETVPYAFTGGDTGGNPVGDLLYDNGLLYGLGSYVRHSNSVLYTFDPSSVESYAVLHKFKKGTAFTVGLTAAGAHLYGSSNYAANASSGYIFRSNPQTGASATVQAFSGGATGLAAPSTALTEAGGALWGGSSYGSPAAGAAFYRFKP